MDEHFLPFKLKEGVDTVSIAVSPEEEANEDEEVEFKRWKGTRRIFEGNWEVIAAGTEVIRQLQVYNHWVVTSFLF